LRWIWIIAIPVLTLKHINDATMPMDPGMITGRSPYLSNIAPGRNVFRGQPKFHSKHRSF
jgi:hypothetical protein